MKGQNSKRDVAEYDEYDGIDEGQQDPVAIPPDGVEAEGAEEEEEEQRIDYTNKVLVENISYLPQRDPTAKRARYIDKSCTLDLPEDLVAMRSKVPVQEFFDAVETWVYNLVSRRNRLQVARCQIFLGS